MAVRCRLLQDWLIAWRGKMSEAERSGEAKPGDVVEVSGHRVGEAVRTGEILEVIGGSGQAHYRVRWEDGHESIFYPSSDAVVRSAHAPGRGTS
jgi:hypothetical protein